MAEDNIVRKENRHGVMKDYVQVQVGTQVIECRKRLRNPITERTHDLTKLSDDGYLKPFLAVYHLLNQEDTINLSSAPVLTFDKDRWEVKEKENTVVLVKREAESDFEERVLEKTE